MAKTSGGTRPAQKMSVVEGYIKAFTAKGGADYGKFASYDTKQNEEKFSKWLENQPKVDNTTAYRGGYMLAGDIVNNLVYGEWEGKTLTINDILSTDATRATSFSLDSNRVLGYTSATVKPKLSYDKFDNENVRVKFNVKLRGKSFVDISKQSHYKEEMEVVAMKKAKFRYISSEYKSSWWEIKLEEI